MRECIIPRTDLDGRGPCSTINECLWYIWKGDPHFDMTTVCAVKNSATSQAHISNGVLWMKKAANIPGFNPSYVNGKDYSIYYNEIYGQQYSISTGTPSNTEDYFFIPIITRNGNLRYWIGTNWVYSSGLTFSVDPTPSPNFCIGSLPPSSYLLNFLGK